MVRASFFQRLRTRKQATESSDKKVILSSLSHNLDDNLQNMKRVLGDSSDLIVRELLIGNLNQRAAIIYLSGITDERRINNNILQMIQSNVKSFGNNILDDIEKEVISVTDTHQSDDLDDIAFSILNGNTAFFMDGIERVLLMGTAGGKERAIEQPDSETLIRGPREGFVESIQTNLALIRRNIKDPNLRFKEFEIGERSKQKLVLCYIEGITNENIITEVNRRLETIDIDYASDSATVEQWIEDSFLSPFPQLLDTERPDRVIFELMQGRIAILLDGSPFALIGPISIADTVHSMEDYNQRWLTSSLLRLLRFLTVIISLILPALYIALVSYHPGMIPITLTYSIAATREGVAFPTGIEAILMAVTFEILHEAGVRLPKIIGQTIGIVGGLVIGESAVSAGIVSPIMVVVTALTAISSFSIPIYSATASFRILRFAFMIAASFLGLYGIALAYIMVNIHFVNLKSIGMPYSVPFSPVFFKDLKDVVIRAPITNLTRRPRYLKPFDNQSKNTNLKKRK
ncbi:spore germination protein [Gracilibacillus caseinilyticus]|uniref:Spore germination protein n=1 Tax=Gracilibacillus caseinilyticus TaxID=2932256 RepID=A0ABY4ESC3_9BACI|nr:spore germination protein [Gracilibacillus caseinilyticus]UOQ46966.1 spore germination protein [Gracilibacillus caseinilyticus]